MGEVEGKTKRRMSASCETDQRKLSGKNKVWILCISNCSFKWQDSTCEMGIVFCKFKVGYLQVVEEKATGFKPKCEFDAYVCAHSPWIHPLLLLYTSFFLLSSSSPSYCVSFSSYFSCCALMFSPPGICVCICVSAPRRMASTKNGSFYPPLLSY